MTAFAVRACAAGGLLSEAGTTVRSASSSAPVLVGEPIDVPDGLAERLLAR